MKQYLKFFKRPTHYLGTEPNSYHKDLEQIKVHVGLAFPDLYEVGMSYYGHKILYQEINARKEFYAERVFAPSFEVADILRKHNTPLCTLESDTPLTQLDVLGFSLTNELAYTTCLYILDLANIPFWSSKRDDDYPLVVAGGGVTFNAEPVAPFFDIMFLGDGEGLILDFLNLFRLAKEQGLSKEEFLFSLKGKQGIYIPSFFKINKKYRGYTISPVYKDYTQVNKYIFPDLNQIEIPTKPILPFGKPVHDRLTLEIARGCTRGCRFCHAGFIYRPVRERTVDGILNALYKGLKSTGYEELSFLSLSTGDFSKLPSLFCKSIKFLLDNQVAISLPSLRVGSVAEKLMEMMSRIRKTGITLAPEAGTQRLRDVINKNITEEEILNYTEKIFSLGWQQVKLYFMLGLPTETKEDLKGIYDLCVKILQTASSKRVRLTASVSLFVPKAHTPFQWCRQLSLLELQERVNFLRSLFKQNRRMQLKWHNPYMSILEGVFSRGGRELAEILVKAYFKGEVFSNWDDFLCFSNWEEIFNDCAIEISEYLRDRDLSEILPWDHLNCGVSKKFLSKEYQKALKAKTTPDCRFENCTGCGVCDFKNKTVLPILNEQEKSVPILNVVSSSKKSKCIQWRIWFTKTKESAYLSQLELQRLFERMFRRLDIPLSFSQGFHPAPLISFGRALPVGIESLEECFQLYLFKKIEIFPLERINSFLPNGLQFFKIEPIPLKTKIPLSIAEDFEVQLEDKKRVMVEKKLQTFKKADAFLIQKKGKKRIQEYNLKKVVKSIKLERNKLKILLNWEAFYLSPLFIFDKILGNIQDVKILKLKQYFKE
ncbi:TIGR03960 family B12-binding radical SAM protein [Desulfonauticus submarinus]